MGEARGEDPWSLVAQEPQAPRGAATGGQQSHMTWKRVPREKPGPADHPGGFSGRPAPSAPTPPELGLRPEPSRGRGAPREMHRGGPGGCLCSALWVPTSSRDHASPGSPCTCSSPRSGPCTRPTLHLPAVTGGGAPESMPAARTPCVTRGIRPSGVEGGHHVGRVRGMQDGSRQPFARRAGPAAPEHLFPQIADPRKGAHPGTRSSCGKMV